MKRIPAILKHLFSSGLRVRVLEHFFFHPGQAFYVRGLAAEIEEPVGTLGRELKNLEKAGMLTSHPIGNQKHYRLDPTCPILEDLRSIFLKTTGAGAELQAALMKVAGVELAFIYGSFASGEAHASSDLDLLIVGDASERALAPAVARVERRLNREVNYTNHTRGEAEKGLGRVGEFLHEVLTGPRIVLIGEENDALFRSAR